MDKDTLEEITTKSSFIDDLKSLEITRPDGVNIDKTELTYIQHLIGGLQEEVTVLQAQVSTLENKIKSMEVL